MSLISLITDSNSPLTKVFSLDGNGKLTKTPAGHVTDAVIETKDLTVSQLADLIPSLSQYTCLCLGALEDYSQPQKLSCNKMTADGVATRSKKYLDFRSDSAFCLLDFDDSGLTPEEALEVISDVDPQLKTAAICVVPSSSSYIYKEDGTEIIGANNFHFYVEVEGSPADYCNRLFSRLILNGHASPCIHANGVVTIKSIVDRAVASAEREIFAADPVFHNKLYSKRTDHIAVQKGNPVIVDNLFPLTQEEELKLRQIYIELRNSVADKAAEAREAYNEKRAEQKARVKGTSKLYELAAINEGSTVYDKSGRPIVELLSSEIILDQQGEEFYVHDIMIAPPDNPVKIPDPAEPTLYGQNGQVGVGVATILTHNMIYSHAHGGQIYTLRWDATDLQEILASEDVSTIAKKLIWRLVSTNQQQLASSTNDSEISEIADAFKKALASVAGSGVGNEKAAIKKKLNPARDSDEAEDEVSLGFNAEYGVGSMNGKTVVVSETWNNSLNVYDVTITKPVELEQYYRHQQVRTQGQSGTRSSFAAWMDSSDRNTYYDVMFEPIPGLIRKPASKRIIQQGGAFNLYTGIIADFDKAKYPEKILAHLKNVWCSGKEDEFAYLCGWLAHLFQKPNSVNGTAIVLQSVPGAGKNIIIDNCIVRHFGQHALSTTRKDDFIGRFNKQLGLNVFLYANESLFAGDHSDKNAVKTLITDQWRTIEMKGIDAVKARNYSSVIFGSNSGWVMNIENLDRRFCYLTVDGTYAKNAEYFSELMKEIDRGGSEGFVKFFMEYDIKGFDITDIPLGNIRQRNSDLIRSSHATVRFFLSLIDKEGSADCVFDNAQKAREVKKWHSGEMSELVMSREELYSLYTSYESFYGMTRGYDDASAMQREFETSGYLAPEGCANHDKYPITTFYDSRNIKMWCIKSRDICQKIVFKC